ncbi:hypothetical protein BGZ79_000377 [Entomortierella chlamydospora]|nr:hypothetical protein BGZ79_000377 [Entomortierella chlamydospora]
MAWDDTSNILPHSFTTLNCNTSLFPYIIIISVTATSVSYNIEEETITLEFPELLYASTAWILDVTYIGLINDKLTGFYRSVYTDAEHNVHHFTTTQFQSTHARGAFPCWDELLAWTIGDLEYIEAYTSGEFNGDRIPCRLYAPVGLAGHGKYSLDLAVQSVEYFSRLFNIPYPLPKLDLVAVPDFSPGAMENWGLITFRLYALLLDEYGGNDRKREIAATVIHEISHQWFGNLVTMDWWSDLWLFEGFATYLAYIAVDDLFSGWDIWSEFVKRIQEVLKHDALRTSHPVEVGVANPSDITQIFDEVSYMKGASVLRMLSAWLGQDQLLKGVRKFMLKYMWGNANTEDLWETLAEECKVDVPEFMRKWTRQTGYPVLSITELDESTVLIRQNLFLSTGDVREEEEDLIWPVPLSLATADNVTPRNIMLNTKEMVLKLDTTKWYKFNMGQTGFYRVAYPQKTLDLLGQTLGSKDGQMLDAANRIGLLTDAAALVASGHTPTSNFLTLLKYFEDEDNYMVWVEISYRLQELFSVWLEQPAPITKALFGVQRRLFTKVVKRLGWTYPEDEDPTIANLRAVAIRYAGRAGDPEIVAEARRRFWEFMGNRDLSAIHPDLRFPVFEIVLRTTTGVEEYEAIVNYYRETYVPIEKVVSLSVLGYGHSPELIHRTLTFALSPEVRSQDILTVIATLRSSVRGRSELWNFMQCHWDTLYERHCDDIRFLDYFILIGIGSFSSLDWYREVQAFFAGKDTSNYERILATCLEGIRMHILWLERDRENVEHWLRVNGYLTAELDEELTRHHAQLEHQQQLLHQQLLQQQQHHQQQQIMSWPVNGTINNGAGVHSTLGHELALASSGRSRSSSSADGFSSSETYYTPGSISSATSSCSSSPPHTYQDENCLHLYQQQEHNHHNHHHHHHHHQRQHSRHQQEHQLQVLQAQQQQQQQQKSQFEMTAHQMNEYKTLNHSSIATAPQTLEGRMESLRVSGEDGL